MEGNLGPFGLHNTLQDLLTCFSVQLQIWKATCLEYPESLNTYLTNPCVALLALLSALHFKGLETNLARIQLLLRIGQVQKSMGWLPNHTSHPNQTYDRSTLPAFLGPSPNSSSQRSHPGMASNISTANTCWAVMVAKERLTGPKGDFGSLFII